MNGAKLAGKTILKVHQARLSKDETTTGRGEWAIEGIEFTDGSFLRFVVLEKRVGTPYALGGLYPTGLRRDEDE